MARACARSRKPPLRSALCSTAVRTEFHIPVLRSWIHLYCLTASRKTHRTICEARTSMRGFTSTSKSCRSIVKSSLSRIPIRQTASQLRQKQSSLRVWFRKDERATSPQNRRHTIKTGAPEPGLQSRSLGFNPSHQARARREPPRTSRSPHVSVMLRTAVGINGEHCRRV